MGYYQSYSGSGGGFSGSNSTSSKNTAVIACGGSVSVPSGAYGVYASGQVRAGATSDYGYPTSWITLSGASQGGGSMSTSFTQISTGSTSGGGSYYTTIGGTTGSKTNSSRQLWGQSLYVYYTYDVYYNYYYTCSAASNNASYGTTTISPSGSQVEGTQITVTFTPASGYRLYQYHDSATGVTTSVSSTVAYQYRFNTYANRTVTGYYEIISYAVTASYGNVGGTVSASSGSVNHGGSCTLTFAADSGYEVDHFTVNGVNHAASELTNGTSYTVSNVTANQTVVAYWKKSSNMYAVVNGVLKQLEMYGCVDGALKGIRTMFVVNGVLVG